MQDVIRDATIEECDEMMARVGYSPNPDCKACHGGGYVHPIKYDGCADYSQTIRCRCLINSYNQFLKNGAVVPGRSVKKMEFGNFIVDSGNKATFEAFKKVSQLDLTFLIVYGKTGNGKTHLCNALMLELMLQNRSVKLFPAAEMVSELKSRINDNTIEDFVSKLKKLDALIIDDYKPEYGSAWEASRVEEIIDARYRDALITVLTTNKDLNSIPDRIVSRFMDQSLGQVVLNNGKNHRMGK